MSIDQLVPILGNAIPQGIFVILFIYLFTETRKDSATREQWFQKAVEKAQANESALAESLRVITATLTSIERHLERIDGERVRPRAT